MKTFGELAAQPVIDLGDGVKVRVGIESRSISVGSGVMIYCLTEGYEPAMKWEGDDRVGPVRVKVVDPLDVQIGPESMSERAQRIVRYCVLDSSEELVTGATLRAP